MRFIALKHLRGDYGSVQPGEEFEVHDRDLCKYLLKAKLVKEPAPFTYETKAIQPSYNEPAIEAPTQTHSNKRK